MVAFKGIDISGPVPTAESTGRVGVVARDSTLYGPVSMLYGVEKAACEAGYSATVVSVGTSRSPSISDAVEILRRRSVEGIVVIAPQASANELLGFTAREIPLIALGDGKDAPIPVVAVDQHDGARRVTEHLLELGHHTIWHVAGPHDSVVARERERSWRQTLEYRGRRVPPKLHGDWSSRSGYEIGKLLVDEAGVDAVFAANDQMALGLVRAFTEAGISVPRDVHVVGFDDIPESARFSPPLTTVRQDFLELGRRTFHGLMERIAGRQPPSLDLLETELIVRESSGVKHALVP